MAERVQGEPFASACEPGQLDRLPESLSDVAVVNAPPERVAEDEVVLGLVRRGEPVLAKHSREGGIEHHFPPARLRLRA